MGSLTEATPILNALVALWVEVKSPAFLAALRKDPDVAALASKEQLEAERKLVVEASRTVEALTGTLAGLELELQREREKSLGEQNTARGEQLKLRAELEGRVAALVDERDTLLLERDGLRAEVTSVTDRIAVLAAEYDGGDHTIVLGAVRYLDADAGRYPLLYFRSQYAPSEHWQAWPVT